MTTGYRCGAAALACILASVASAPAQRPRAARIRAQQLVEQTVARHPELRGLELALLSDSGCATVAATAPEDIGERCDDDEWEPIRTGRADIEAPSRQDPVYDITQALHDPTGTVIGAVGMDIAPRRGETQASALRRARSILREMESAIGSRQSLLEPVSGGAPPDHDPHAPAASPDTSGFRLVMSFPIVDTASLYEAKLGSRLVVRATHERDAAGTSMGWWVSVVEVPARAESRNLLYHSLGWHGPYPTDVFAWIHRDRYYPDDRTLSVYGWPYDLRLVCRSCEVAGDSTRVHFVAGTLEIGMRRLGRANPAPSH